jgi:hypothetical protein
LIVLLQIPQTEIVVAGAHQGSIERGVRDMAAGSGVAGRERVLTVTTRSTGMTEQRDYTYRVSHKV